MCQMNSNYNLVQEKVWREHAVDLTAVQQDRFDVDVTDAEDKHARTLLTVVLQPKTQW